jgi:hypothetical protein
MNTSRCNKDKEVRIHAPKTAYLNKPRGKCHVYPLSSLGYSRHKSEEYCVVKQKKHLCCCTALMDSSALKLAPGRTIVAPYRRLAMIPNTLPKQWKNGT